MKLFWRISELSSMAASPSKVLCLHCSRSLFSFFVSRGYSCDVTPSPVAETSSDVTAPSPSNQGKSVYELFFYSTKHRRQQLGVAVDNLMQDLIRDGDEVKTILDKKFMSMLTCHSNGSAFVELMARLIFFPQLALEILSWRRKLAESDVPMTMEEYSKCITVAGRLKNVDLAVELFEEACCRDLKRTSTYNALLGAFMYNGHSDKCQILYKNMKKELYCSPSIVTYNIMLSVFGRTVLVDQMEEVFREIVEFHMSPNLSTFKNLISGYLTAWMWDSMEKTYFVMQQCSVKPDLQTYLFMLRGYALSGNLEQMEAIYELVKDHVDSKEIPLLRCVICAYYRSSAPDKVQKVEKFLRLVSEENYVPWFNVQTIRFYANEGMLEMMEKSIDEAFEHNTVISTVNVMRAIIAAYFRFKSLDRLVGFVKRAECAGWRICRSMYHCKMLMCGSENRLLEMEDVLNEMEKFRLDITRKTLIILYNSYLVAGQFNKVKLVVGYMCKSGYEFPSDYLSEGI